MIDILLSAFLLSVVLLGIHSYYGLHIIERGIIFTDLGIGQMAAFGAAISILAFDGKYMYPVSLAFSLAGAFLIALSTKRTRNHEAFIGLLYAFGMSAAVIALSRAPRGAEEMQHLVAADILFVPMIAVLKTAGLYLAIGAVLWFTMGRLRGTLKEMVFFGTFSLTGDLLKPVEKHGWFLVSDLAGILGGLTTQVSYVTVLALLLCRLGWRWTSPPPRRSETRQASRCSETSPASRRSVAGTPSSGRSMPS